MYPDCRAGPHLLRLRSPTYPHLRKEVFAIIDKEAVHRIRQSRGLSVSALADRMGAHRPDVSAWSNGRITPTLSNAVKLAQALGCPLDDLLVKQDSDL